MARRGAQPNLTPGVVYRTSSLARWGKNPFRLAQRLVRDGKLTRVGPGLYAAPRPTAFGPMPPPEEQVLNAFLKRTPFVVTGPTRWNPLGLGSTGLHAVNLVYNTKRSGEFKRGGTRFLLRRVAFPPKPPAEWFVVDLLENHRMAGVDLDAVARRLAQALAKKRFHRARLRDMASRYGTQRTRELVERALERSRSHN